MSRISRQTLSNPAVLTTDLDGTLIPLDRNEQNRRDLRRLRDELRDSGITLTFVTGRHREIVEEAIDEHQLPQPDWIICDVGTSIYRQTQDGWQPVDAYQGRLGGLCAAMPIAALRDHISSIEGLKLQEEEKQGDYKLSFYANQKRLTDVADRVSRWISEHDAPWTLIDSVDPFTGDGLIDLLPAGVSKAFAIEWWREHAGYEKPHVVYAGDSGNDLAPLTAGYRAIVVSNASRELAERVKQHHTTQGWTDRLHLASTPATSGVLEGCLTFGLFGDEVP